MPLGIWLATRTLHLALVWILHIAVFPNPDPHDWTFEPDRPLLDSFFRWDAGWSMLVARDGYAKIAADGAMPGTLAPVLPLYPLLVRGLNSLGIDSTLAAVALSNIAFLLALVLLHRFVAPRFGSEAATAAVTLLALYPFALYGGVATPDALALALVLGAWLGWEHEHRWVGGTLAALAGLAAPVALPLSLALAVQGVAGRSRPPLSPPPPRVGSRSLSGPRPLLTSTREPGEVRGGWLGLLPAVIPILGALAFATYLRRALGLGWEQSISVVVGLPRAGVLPRGLLLDEAFAAGGAGPLVLGGALAVVVSIAALPRTRQALGWGAAVWLGSLALLGLVGQVVGSGRLLLAGFPLFVLLAVFLSPAARGLTVATFGLGFGLLTVLWVAWYPVDRLDHSISPSLVTMRRASIERFATWSGAKHRVGGEVPGRLVIWGYDLSDDRVAPGDALRVVVHYSLPRLAGAGFQMEARLTDGKGSTRALGSLIVKDAAPPGNLLETDVIRRGEASIGVPSNLPSGVYGLDLLVFGLPAFERLDLVDLASRLPRDAPHAEITVLRPEDAARSEQGAALCQSAVLLGDGITLAQVDLPSATARPGDTLSLALYWEARAGVARDYTVFVQVIGPDGRLVAQSDAYPLDGRFPTSRWRVGDVVRDPRSLHLPADLASGRYRIVAGMYLLETTQRLPTTPVEPPAARLGQVTTTCAAAGDHIVIATVEVR